MKKKEDALPCGKAKNLLKRSNEIVSGGINMEREDLLYFMKLDRLEDVCPKLRKNDQKGWTVTVLNFPDLGVASCVNALPTVNDRQVRISVLEVKHLILLLDEFYDGGGDKAIAAKFALKLTDNMTDIVTRAAHLSDLGLQDGLPYAELADWLSRCCLELGAKYHSVMTKRETAQLMENFALLGGIETTDRNFCPMLRSYAVCVKKWIMLYDLIENKRLQLLSAWKEAEKKGLKLAKCYEGVKRAHETAGTPEHDDAILGSLLANIGGMLEALNDNIALLRKELRGEVMSLEDIIVCKLNYLLRELLEYSESGPDGKRILDEATVNNLTAAFSEIVIQMEFADLNDDIAALADAYGRESWGHALHLKPEEKNVVIYTLSNIMSIYSDFIKNQQKNADFKEIYEKRDLLKLQFTVFLRILADSNSKIDVFQRNISRKNDKWKNMGVILYHELKERFRNQDFWHEK